MEEQRHLLHMPHHRHPQPVQPLSSLALALTLFLTAAGAVGAAIGGGGARVGVLVGGGVAPHLAQAWR
eukprot:2853972-Rhodomonas_salina.1